MQFSRLLSVSPFLTLTHCLFHPSLSPYLPSDFLLPSIIYFSPLSLSPLLLPRSLPFSVSPCLFLSLSSLSPCLGLSFPFALVSLPRFLSPSLKLSLSLSPSVLWRPSHSLPFALALALVLLFLSSSSLFLSPLLALALSGGRRKVFSEVGYVPLDVKND